VLGLGRSLAVVGAGVSLLILAPSAEAGQLARVSGDAVIFTAFDTEVNNVTVGYVPGPPGSAGTHTFSDPGNDIFTTDGPGNCENVTLDTASCPAAEGDLVIANLGDEADKGASTASVGTAICGGPSADEVTGGEGPDLLLGEEDEDTITGGAGTDIVITDTVTCRDDPNGPPAQNNATGGTGDDALIGGLGDDTMRGGDGGDTIFGARLEDGVSGDDGDHLYGDGGEDIIVGHDGDDLLDGGGDFDTLVGGLGDDEQLGGGGDDVLGITTNQAFEDTQGQVHPLVTRDPGKDRLEGGSGDDLLQAGPGEYVLNFGVGDLDSSEVTEANGPDDFRGGPGRDTVTYANLALPVRVTPDEAADDGSAEEGDNVRADNEVVVGGSVGDTLIGSGSNDTLDGGKGDDQITGGDGSDVLNGGGGDGGADLIAGGSGGDSLDGGPGDDSLDGEFGSDLVDGGGGNDRAGGGGDPDRVSGGAGLDVVAGGLGDDRLLGSGEGVVGADGADSLLGDEGNDELDGGPADDTLAGGPGADLMAGSDGVDTADYGSADGPVTATLNGTRGDGERNENDDIRGDVEGLRGGRRGDDLIGGPTANVIDGGPGEDYVDGSRGRDRLQGGRGSDAVRSRDNTSDRVGCGGARDFAIADDSDTVRGDCERGDLGGPRRPALGRAMVARPVRGSNRLRVAGMHRFIPFLDALRLPFGSSFDATVGAVRVSTAGSRSSGRFSGGRFGVRQRRRGRAPTRLRLEGRTFAGCAGARTVRRLRGRTRGRFRIGARRSTTSVRRGSWVVADRCNGTLTRVRRGRATVLDKRGRRVALRAGRSYLAPAR
jgi:Ca2+-binding RTX toxin-like protein